MVEVMAKTGASLDSLLDLPMERFTAVYEAMLRVDARMKTDNLWTARVAQHGEPKDVTKLEESWMQRSGTRAGRHKSDMNAFLRAVGKGF